MELAIRPVFIVAINKKETIQNSDKRTQSSVTQAKRSGKVESMLPTTEKTLNFLIVEVKRDSTEIEKHYRKKIEFTKN